jgi:hypothetical protein
VRHRWPRITRSRWGLFVLLVGLGVLDYSAAKGLRALRDRVGAVPSGPAAGAVVLSAGSPVTLAVPGTAGIGSGAVDVAVPVTAGVSVFVAPSVIDQVELAGAAGATPVDPFGLPDSAGSSLPVPQANRGALIARLDADPPFAIGSRSCIFTATRAGRLRFAVNDGDPSRNRGGFSVTLSIPEIRSVLAATPACGTVLE